MRKINDREEAGNTEKERMSPIESGCLLDDEVAKRSQVEWLRWWKLRDGRGTFDKIIQISRHQGSLLATVCHHYATSTPPISAGLPVITASKICYSVLHQG